MPLLSAPGRSPIEIKETNEAVDLSKNTCESVEDNLLSNPCEPENDFQETAESISSSERDSIPIEVNQDNEMNIFDLYAWFKIWQMICLANCFSICMLGKTLFETNYPKSHLKGLHNALKCD